MDGVTEPLTTSLAAKVATADLGLKFITSSAFTTSTAVNVNNCFTSTYDNYLVLVSPSAASANAELNMRLRVGGVDATGNDVSYGGRDVPVTGSGVDRQAANASSSIWLGGVASSFFQSFAAVVVMSPALARYTMGSLTSWNYDGSSTYGRSMSFRHNLTTAYDGFTIFPSTGNISGALRVYGYKNS